jgi:hypothetical protein
MNERIRELAEQAGFKVNWQHEDVQAIKMARFEKFAELIVSECSRIADDWVNNEDNGKNYPSDKIKQHFGVGE